MDELQAKDNLSRNEKMNYANILNSIGSAYLGVQRYDSALHYHFSSLNMYHDLQAEDNISIVHQNLGINYSEQGKNDSAKVFLTRAVDARRKIFGDKNFRTSTSLRYLGDHFSRMNQPDSALKYYQQAVVAGSAENFRSYQPSDNPSRNDFIFDGSLLSALREKGAALRAIYQRDLKTDDLTNSLKTLQLAIDLMDENQAMYELEGSSLLLSRDFYEVFEAALSACHTLFQVLNDPKYLEIAFMIMEKSKARLLYDTFKGLQLSQEVGIPDSLWAKENSIRSQLASFTKDLEKEQTNMPIDAGKIARLEEDVFQSTVALEQFHEDLESAYPSYASSTRSELMNLPSITNRLSEENKGLVSYFWGNTDLFTLMISKGKISFYRQPIDTVEKQLNNYQKHLIEGPQFTNQAARFQQFARDAHNLYRVLFNNTQLEDQPLIIATDGPLRLIPFEALVTELPNDISNDYSELTYLLNKFPTSYIYSANLWAMQPELEAGEMRTLGIGHSSMGEDLKGPNELPGTAREIELLQSQLKGLFLSGSKATKQSFLRYAQDYNIIHLAIHGISDSISRLNNRLLFRNPDHPDQTESLYTYELYNLRLNSRLAVLSACESGVGKNFQGEGVYSMSRAFSYAGCPTTVMSLWRISDKTTPKILESFYRQISNGHPVDVALQQAKIQYLADYPQNLSHPAYWAAMVMYGNTDKLIDNPSKLNLVLPLVLIGILSLVFYARRKRNLHQSG